MLIQLKELSSVNMYEHIELYKFILTYPHPDGKASFIFPSYKQTFQSLQNG